MNAKKFRKLKVDKKLRSTIKKNTVFCLLFNVGLKVIYNTLAANLTNQIILGLNLKT